MNSIYVSGGSTGSLDWGYCVLTAVNAYYYLGNVWVLCYTVSRDSHQVEAFGWDHTIQQRRALSMQDAAMQEEVVSLVANHGGLESKLVDVFRNDGVVMITPDQDLLMGDLIGGGGFGHVYRATFHGVDVAVKQIAMDRSSVASFVNEVKSLSGLRHPNVLLLMGIGLSRSMCWLVSEFCSQGSLWEHLRNRGDTFLKVRRRIAYETAAAMAFLHSRGVAHRDLKSPNVLLTESLSVRVGDFGLSKKHLAAASVNTFVGTPAWTAPEVLQRAPYSLAADVYSFGVILWELDTLQPPYANLDAIQVAVGVVTQEISLLYPVQDGEFLFRGMTEKCLARDPTERPSFAVLLSWFQDHI